MALKPISRNWANTANQTGDPTNFEILQKEVEETDLAKWLGDAFLLDLQTNFADAKYQTLLNGTTFEDCDGNDVKFQGIKYQLAYMDYAQTPVESSTQSTYSGFVNKQRDESRDASKGSLKDLKSRAQEIASRDFEKMKIYLDDNTDVYTLWNCTKTKKFYKPRIQTFRKTYN